jgi:ribosome maturation factor RimP
MSWQGAIETTVTGFGYELVECERAAAGLLRVTIDRVPGHAYGVDVGGDSAFVTVEDCERVTRQLQLVLEVEGVDYKRLEVSSPGLDRPLKKPADYERFAGEQIDLTLKLAFEGRKRYQGVLAAAGDPGDTTRAWALHFNDGKQDQVLGFRLEEVREARLVPVVNFKGRAPQAKSPRQSAKQTDLGSQAMGD